MSDTPKTDDEEVSTGSDWMPRAVPSDFARTLERKNTQLQQDILRLDRLETKARLERDAFGAENERLHTRVKELMDSLMLG